MGVHDEKKWTFVHLNALVHGTTYEQLHITWPMAGRCSIDDALVGTNVASRRKFCSAGTTLNLSRRMVKRSTVMDCASWYPSVHRHAMFREISVKVLRRDATVHPSFVGLR